MANTYGRQVVVPLTNKSGGGVIAGDVVIVDTTNNDAFTTTTSANFTGTVGIAQATIASNAVGPVLLSGYAALVNVNASVTRGHYGATYTTVKEATDAGAARGVGTFCQFLTGGATPDATVWPVDLLGSSLTNPMTTVGDMIQGTTAGAPVALAAPAAGKVLTGAGTTTPLVYAYPPGYQYDYAEFTSTVGITATSEATANNVVTGNAIAYDGSTAVWVEFECPGAGPDLSAAGRTLLIILYDSVGTTSIGWIAYYENPAATQMYAPVHVTRKITPSAATHTYSIKAWVNGGTGEILAGVGGAGAFMPGHIRITKA
jgi:hypothetical protein